MRYTSAPPGEAVPLPLIKRRPNVRHHLVFNFRWAHMDADHLRDLAAAIYAARSGPARRLTRAQAGDQFLAQFTGRQGIDRVVDCLASDVGLSEARNAHAAQLAGKLLGMQTLTWHMGYQPEAFFTREQLSHRAEGQAARLHLLLGHTRPIDTAGSSIAAQLPADGRSGSADRAGNPRRLKPWA